MIRRRTAGRSKDWSESGDDDEGVKRRPTAAQARAPALTLVPQISSFGSDMLLALCRATQLDQGVENFAPTPSYSSSRRKSTPRDLGSDSLYQKLYPNGPAQPLFQNEIGTIIIY